MFREDLHIAYDAPADLKKWPSLNNQRLTSKTPYLIHTGTLADCIRELSDQAHQAGRALRHRDRAARGVRKRRDLARRRRRDRHAQGFPETSGFAAMRHARASPGHPCLEARPSKTWMAGTSPAMTKSVQSGSCQVRPAAGPLSAGLSAARSAASSAANFSRNCCRHLT